MTSLAASDSYALNLSLPAFGRPRSQLLALAVAVALHGAVGWAVLKASPATQPPAEPAVIRTELVMLPAPAAPAPAPQPVAAPAPVPTPAPAPVKPAPKVTPPPPVAKADLARQRVVEQQHQQQQRQEQARQEVQARQQAEAEQARQRQADADARAAREQADARARQAHEAQALASQQYLPISKKAPEYPERALDDGLEGDCTVEYRVDTTGHVRDPRVVGSCHPLFMRPSLAAAATFVYRPRVIDGQAQEVAAVRNTFHYRIGE